MVAFFIGAILYFVGYAVQTFRNDITTVTVYETGVEDSMDTTGLVVRQETLLEGSGERMEVLPAEGESVAKGEVIARIYKDQAALEQHQLSLVAGGRSLSSSAPARVVCPATSNRFFTA